VLRGPLLLVACAAALVCAASAAAVTAKTTRVSVNSSEQPANNNSGSYGTISLTGRFVVFDSQATTLVPSDTNGFSDVFLRDRRSGTTRRVSLDSAEGEGNGSSFEPSVSGNGHFVAFESNATNLVPGDTNGADDIFLRDRKTGMTRRVSVSSAGAQATGPVAFSSLNSVVSANGRFVAYQSSATNLVPNDTSGLYDVFVYDRLNKTTKRVDVKSSGDASALGADSPSISANGRFVAFETASRLTGADMNKNQYDIYVRDRKLKQTRLVSVRSNGAQANAECLSPLISENGRFVAFNSVASNLVRHDTGGHYDAFVHDRRTGKTFRASVNSKGRGGNGESQTPTVSNNGKFILFASTSTNLAPNDDTPGTDIFLRNMLTGKTRLVSVSRRGHEGNGNSFIYYRSLSADGRWASFESAASNLVENDSVGGYDDVFVRGPLH